jgi:hypothetical protein
MINLFKNFGREMDAECSTHGSAEKCIQNFGRKT